MIAAFIRYYFSRTVKNWRLLRRACMDALPPVEKASDVENGKP